MENNPHLPAPYPSWTTYDPDLMQWFPPAPYPNDGQSYLWDESSLAWVPVNNEPAQGAT